MHVAAALLALLAPPQEAHYVDASLSVDGTLLAAEFVDVDLDGRNEAVLAVRTQSGARELRIHDFTADGIARAARRTLRVLDDVVAWTLADVRPEPGRELVLLTRTGAFSLDPNVEELRGNVRRLIETPLLYDVPDPLALPYWAYVVRNGERDELLLPDRNGFALYAAGAEPEAAWVRRATWPASGGSVARDPDDAERRKKELERDRDRGEARFEVTVGEGVEPFLGEPSTTTLASDGRSMRAPAVVDIDGDGRRDLLLLVENKLQVHIAGPNGIPAAPTRSEVVPEYLRRNDRVSSLRLVDLDGDGRLDVLAIWNAKIDGFENVDWRVFMLLSQPDRVFPAEPTQMLRFESAGVRVDVGRIDGDARPDLVVRTFELPSKLAAATGLTFKHEHLLYRGERGGFERRPTMRHSRTFDENGVREVLANRRMELDCSGDGLADLVEVGIDGKIVIKRLRKQSGFLSGTKWSLDDAPWKSYATRGSVLSLEVEDLNGDGLGDVVSRGESGLTLLLSRKGGR